jgi:hypothetical protein
MYVYVARAPSTRNESGRRPWLSPIIIVCISGGGDFRTEATSNVFAAPAPAAGATAVVPGDAIPLACCADAALAAAHNTITAAIRILMALSPRCLSNLKRTNQAPSSTVSRLILSVILSAAKNLRSCTATTDRVSPSFRKNERWE